MKCCNRSKSSLETRRHDNSAQPPGALSQFSSGQKRLFVMPACSIVGQGSPSSRSNGFQWEPSVEFSLLFSVESSAFGVPLSGCSPWLGQPSSASLIRAISSSNKVTLSESYMETSSFIEKITLNHNRGDNFNFPKKTKGLLAHLKRQICKFFSSS